MKIINATGLDFKELNEEIRKTDEAEIIGLEGQRYIGCGTEGKKLYLCGFSGNGLGSFMNGGEIIVYGNAQDQICDTMNDGIVVVHGSAGDAAGYAMRGGEIYIEGKVGYRAGIHMKEYGDKKPVIVVGENAGSFLGEYQAGGLIVVLNLKNASPVGFFCGTGMHGGKIFLRTEEEPVNISPKVNVAKADKNDLKEIKKYITKFAELFKKDVNSLLNSTFYILTPDSNNPYKELYIQN